MKKLLELYLPINFSETFRSLNTEEIPLIAVVKEPDLLCAFISLFSLENYDTFFFADFARKLIVIRELPVRFMRHFFFSIDRQPLTQPKWNIQNWAQRLLKFGYCTIIQNLVSPSSPNYLFLGLLAFAKLSNSVFLLFSDVNHQSSFTSLYVYNTEITHHC